MQQSYLEVHSDLVHDSPPGLLEVLNYMDPDEIIIVQHLRARNGHKPAR